jgi:hypothetical protein
MPRRPYGLLDAEVQHRQHVEPPEAEHQEHLRRPRPHALDLRQCLDDGGVVTLGQGVERDRARGDLPREVPKVAELLW